MNTFLIVGLGNIGIDYQNTRHNIGFTVLDALTKQVDISFSTLRYGDVAEMNLKGKRLVLLKPSTLMNRSGNAVRYWMKQRKVNSQNILVITDDVHLDFGYLRIRKQGSDGGHNGLRDIQDKLEGESHCHGWLHSYCRCQARTALHGIILKESQVMHNLSYMCVSDLARTASNALLLTHMSSCHVHDSMNR